MSFPECHMIGITQYVAFTGWLVWLSDMHLLFLCVFSWLFLFLVLNNIPLSGSTTIYLSIHLLNHLAFKISFYYVCVLSCSDSATLWTIARQAPLSIAFSGQEYCSGLPFPSPWDHPDLKIKLESPVSPALQADSLPTEPFILSWFTLKTEIATGTGLSLLNGIATSSLLAPTWHLSGGAALVSLAMHHFAAWEPAIPPEQALRQSEESSYMHMAKPSHIPFFLQPNVYPPASKTIIPNMSHQLPHGFSFHFLIPTIQPPKSIYWAPPLCRS